MAPIKIGIECSLAKLRSDLLLHPSRYFFILTADNHAALCIQTCDASGEDIQAHAFDGLKIDSEGNLVSIFEDELRAAAVERNIKRGDGEDHLISPALEERIREQPGFVDWVISFLLTKQRNLLIHSAWVI
jgi:hypothetical protein